jgi:cation:H+ antiporter
LALLVGLIINLVWELVSAMEQRQRQRSRDSDADALPVGGMAPALGLQGLGIGLLVLGSDLLLRGALSAARLLEVDEAVIGLTLVAAGTSLPELVTSLVAAYRGRADLAIGNAVGSSLFNLLLILGMGVLFSGSSGIAVPAVLLQRDLPVLVVVTLICLPLLWSYATITATDGALLLLIYGVYLVEQVVLAKLPTAIGTFRLAVLVGAGPVLAFLGWSVVSWWRVRDRGDGPTSSLTSSS